MDFGLAKRLHEPHEGDGDTTAGSLTEAGTMLGTPAYMSPEQLRGEPVETRSDIFSFGVVLFELLTGAHPFKRDTVSEMVAAILRDPPSRGDGHGGQVDYAVLDRLLAKAPDDRYQSFDEVLVEVRRLRDMTFDSPEPLSEREDASEPPLGSRRTRYVGRETEQVELGRALERVIRGRGGLALIGGEPGVGKTRLVEQVLAQATHRRCLTLTGRCYEMEGTPPIFPPKKVL